MFARILLVGLVGVAVALPSASPVLADGEDATTAASIAKKKRKRCAKGKVRRGGKCVRRRRPAAPAPPAAPPATPPAPTPPQSQLIPDDAAARQALANGLQLERSEWGSVSATYYRMFFYPNGVFKYYEVGWNQVSGELCTRTEVGTWSLNTGYRFEVQGGGVVAVVNLNAGAINGTEILSAANQDANYVYVGPNQQAWEVNPHMRDSC